MRIGNTGYSQPYVPTVARQTSTPAFSVNGSTAPSATSGMPKASSDEQVNFSHMTRQQMRDWVNQQITSGRMTVDESTPFVSMTMHIPVNGTAMDDGSLTSEYVNFLDIVKQGMAGARSRGNQHETQMLMDALTAMQKSTSSRST